MADLSSNFKQRMFRTISFRFPSSSDRGEDTLESISEEPNLENNASKDSQLDVIQRPLPMVPQTFEKMPWYKSVDRAAAEGLLKNCETNGSFVVRPSLNGRTALTLTLWYGQRSYNIQIRHRVDGQYALGTPKALEQNFATVEEMIEFYNREEIVLYSGGIETGRTVLRPLIA